MHERPPAVAVQFGDVAVTSATTVGAPVTATVTDVASDETKSTRRALKAGVDLAGIARETAPSSSAEPGDVGVTSPPPEHPLATSANVTATTRPDE